jgi:hypothetical protein
LQSLLEDQLAAAALAVYTSGAEQIAADYILTQPYLEGGDAFPRAEEVLSSQVGGRD